MVGRVVRDRQRDTSAGKLAAGSVWNAQNLSVIEKSQSVRQSRGKFARAGSLGRALGCNGKLLHRATRAPNGAVSKPLHLGRKSGPQAAQHDSLVGGPCLGSKGKAHKQL